jgi:hypothetical protein
LGIFPTFDESRMSLLFAFRERKGVYYKSELTIRTIQKGEKAILGPILEARMAIHVIS